MVFMHSKKFMFNNNLSMIPNARLHELRNACLFNVNNFFREKKVHCYVLFNKVYFSKGWRKNYSNKAVCEVFRVWPLTFEKQKLCNRLISIWEEQHSFVLFVTTTKKLFCLQTSLLWERVCSSTAFNSASDRKIISMF